MVARTSYIKTGGALAKFRAVVNLVAGANVINDNLALAAPFARLVEMFEHTTGEAVNARVTVETANTFTITAAVALANVRITVI